MQNPAPRLLFHYLHAEIRWRLGRRRRGAMIVSGYECLMRQSKPCIVGKAGPFAGQASNLKRDSRGVFSTFLKVILRTTRGKRRQILRAPKNCDAERSARRSLLWGRHAGVPLALSSAAAAEYTGRGLPQGISCSPSSMFVSIRQRRHKAPMRSAVRRDCCARFPQVVSSCPHDFVVW